MKLYWLFVHYTIKGLALIMFDLYNSMNLHIIEATKILISATIQYCFIIFWSVIELDHLKYMLVF